MLARWLQPCKVVLHILFLLLLFSSLFPTNGNLVIFSLLKNLFHRNYMINSLKILKSFLCHIRLEFSFSVRNYIVVHSFQSLFWREKKVKLKAKDGKIPFARIYDHWKTHILSHFKRKTSLHECLKTISSSRVEFSLQLPQGLHSQAHFTWYNLVIWAERICGSKVIWE